MLTRKIEHIVRDLSQGIATTLGRATAEDLAEFSPRFFALLQATEAKGKPAPAAKAAPRAAVAPPPPRAVQAPKKVGKSAPPPPSKARWGASSMKEAILELLAKHPALRSEEIQAQLGSAPDVTRVALTDLFLNKRIRRQGQARGTKYSLNKSSRASKAADEDNGVDAAALGRALEQATSKASGKAARQAPSHAEPAEVTTDQINTVRRQLAEHAAPMLVGELARALELDKPLVKATLEEMLRRNLVERTGMGNAARFSLSSHAPASRSETAGDRVLRRPPRGKWGAAENAEESHDTSAAHDD